MSWTRRRFVLSSVAVTVGAALLPPPLALASPASARPVWLLASKRGPSSFERGVLAALAEAGLSEPERLELPSRGDAARWRQAPSLLRGAVVLGLVDPAEFVLVNELAREMTARMLCEGEHAVGADDGADWAEAVASDLVRVATGRGAALPRVAARARRSGAVRSRFTSFVFLP